MKRSHVLPAFITGSLIGLFVVSLLWAFSYYGPTFEYEQPEWLTVERNGYVQEDISFTARFRNFFPGQWKGRSEINPGIQPGDVLTIDLDSAFSDKPEHRKHREGDTLYRFDIGNGLFPGDPISSNTIFLSLIDAPHPSTGILRVTVDSIEWDSTEAWAQHDTDNVTWFWLRQYYVVYHAP